MSNSAKQALAAQLTAALAPVLPLLPVPLPNGIAQAVDELAESILRWQARQQRPTRPSGAKRTAEVASDELVRLLDSRMYEEEEGLSQEIQPTAVDPGSLIPSLPSKSLSPVQQKRRPRLDTK